MEHSKTLIVMFHGSMRGIAVHVGDLNGDDKPDILMGGFSNLVLWRNKGDGAKMVHSKILLSWRI
jgi:hypothetical protein